MKKQRRRRMKKKQRLKSVEFEVKSAEFGFEFEFPEEIIQHIQSLMCAKGAARTALLSKSWHRAWSTRPILCLDKLSSATNEGFGRFARKTMQRYEDLNLKLHTFSIRTESYGDDYSISAELIPRALKLGAIHLEIQTPVGTANLPDEVLQSETLASLCVHGCFIGDRIREKMSCSNLKILKLSDVAVIRPDVIMDLISGCPLLEELTLECPNWGPKLPFDVATLVKLHKLRYLRLASLKFGDSLFRSELWPKFGCLKELELLNFSQEGKVLRICSTSLECIYLCSRALGVSLSGEFDVPNLRTFVVCGRGVPLIKLKTSGKREVRVHIHCSIKVRGPWCSSLKKAVERIKLRPSRVSISILLLESYGDGDGDGGGYVGDGLPIPVENLKILGCRFDAAVLEDLLCCFRPSFVAIEGQFLFGIRKVDVERFQQLPSLPWMTLLDASSSCKYFEFVRFQLK